MVIVWCFSAGSLVRFSMWYSSFGRLWVWLRVIVENSVGYRSWGLLVEMRHWVECQVASAIVEWMIERQGSFGWIDQGGDVFC